MTPTISDFFRAGDGIIASVKNGFAPRAGQEELTKLIYDAFRNNQSVIAEAPTGFGKSFTVLVAAIIKTLMHGGRVVISTETLTLQDQYINKDLPLLRDACAQHGIHFKYAVAKGRGNYICRAKVDEDEFEGADDLMRWARKQRVFYEEAGAFRYDTGDIGSVPFDFETKQWQAIGCDEDCEKSACPYFGEGRKGSDCFCYTATKRFLDAQIIVTNHTLLLLDAQVGAGVLLGPYDMLIVDEAHSLPEKAQDAWGTSIKPRTISRTMRLVDKILMRVGVDYFRHGFLEQYRVMERAVLAPFDAVIGKNIALKQVKQHIVDESKQAADLLVNDLKKAYRDINDLICKPEEDPETIAINTGKEKIAKLIHDLKVVYGDKIDEEYAENWLSFLETGYNVKREPYGILNLKPIDVGPLMKGLIFDMIPSVVMMSATMKINGNFHFMRRELGMPEGTICFTGESPFDYSKQVVGYFPKHLPDPDDEEHYLEVLIDEITKVIGHMDGRTMILFTNVSQMRLVWEGVSRRVPYHCYVQGQAQKQALINMFQENQHSCLFATRSFFTGVDIPGETLSCVALVKAPFRVPTEPMFKAKCDSLEKNGINSFAHYSLPLMLFDVRQAFGRLIRTTNDQGMFVLLDSRALKKSYGSNIRRSLPEISEVTVVGEAPAKPKPKYSLASLELDD